MSTENKLRSRSGALDILRAVSCLAVVMIHVSAQYTLAPLGSFTYWVGMVADAASQFAVPMFVMISGALYLNEDYDYQSKKLWKHIKELVIFFYGWSAVYCAVFTVLRAIVQGAPLRLQTVLLTFLRGPYHLWFIPMMVGLYLTVPLLRLWVKRDNRKQAAYFLLLGLVLNTLLPQLKTVLGYLLPGSEGLFAFTDGMFFYYPVSYLFYFVLGWYLYTFEIEKKRLLYGLGIASVLLCVFGNYGMTLWKQSEGFFFGSFSVNIVLYCAALFVFAKTRTAGKETTGAFTDLLCRSGKGVYAIHVAVHSLFIQIIRIPNAAIAICAEFIIACTLSMAVTFLLRRIPGLKRLV